ncbi:MAG: cysteine--tRNA ligase [Candidatus Omnitrophica bacterium]|nr:cysteine--tRNA ligase [Candidatus Omnitrophota bacterium]
MHIYNSLTRKKEEFIPVNPAEVNMYTCGVTVYDECHIGHARSLFIFDLIKRYLTYRGFKVNFVRNITDIDDKIINRANELKVNWDELVKKYIDRYYEDLKSLGIAKAEDEPRATENIPDMVKYIEGLIEKGFAYESAGDVYFNVRKFPDYGKLSGQSIDHMEEGVRVEPTENKKDPLDFALWKTSKENEPSWESPWGRGRPGWHIECSVMSRKFLKTDTLDIHAGGRDLIFPHHENEIAQAEALTGKPFAKYWMHHGLLTINGQKMAKSAGNFVTAKDFLASHKDADILKIFFLSAHYSSPIDYSDAKIKSIKQARERIFIFAEKIESELSRQDVNSLPREISYESLRKIWDRFIAAMDDDFNTPAALSCVFDLVSITNKNIDSIDFINNARALFRQMFSVLGLSFRPQAQMAGRTPEEVEQKILEREKARKAGNFTLADKIRAELEEMGILLEDGEDGTTWRRKL